MIGKEQMFQTVVCNIIELQNFSTSWELVDGGYFERYTNKYGISGKTEYFIRCSKI